MCLCVDIIKNVCVWFSFGFTDSARTRTLTQAALGWQQSLTPWSPLRTTTWEPGYVVVISSSRTLGEAADTLRCDFLRKNQKTCHHRNVLYAVNMMQWLSCAQSLFASRWLSCLTPGNRAEARGMVVINTVSFTTKFISAWWQKSKNSYKTLNSRKISWLAVLIFFILFFIFDIL